MSAAGKARRGVTRGLATFGSGASLRSPRRRQTDRRGLDGVAIYSGRDHIGSTYDLGGRYAAELVDGTDLGIFPNARAAADAIFAALRGRP